MKPEIENLKAWMSGRSTTGYQRALAMREFEQLLSYVTELEQLRQPPVIGSVCDNCGEGNPTVCGKCYETESNFRESY
jgi:hypothetical protein